jgi:hypothetical protein
LNNFIAGYIGILDSFVSGPLAQAENIIEWRLEKI